MQSLTYTYKRLKTLQTNKISALPVVILMPHSACNCRCVMCDIWKDNKNLKQLSEDDVYGLLSSFKKFGTQQVVMSGGEATLHPNFFRFCEILRKEKINVSLLSTGLTLKRNAQQLTQWVNDIIISIDGDEALHDTIRNIPGAFIKIKEGIQAIRAINPHYKITARTVIHKLNYQSWISIIESAKTLQLNQISFLPADVSSHAFNREVLWNASRQDEILLGKEELPLLKNIIEAIKTKYSSELATHFIAEPAEKLEKIYLYYSAFYKLNPFPYKKCNAPWVSAVIEADGTVRPCFFHESIGNIHDDKFDEILNGEKGMYFRQSIDMDTNNICKKCVCYLNLPLHINFNNS
ncbi:MAG: radical SAM protein [Bacteroidetes bacterium]|nr:radical SAM protein [Bacteroidota bacterium]